MYLGLIQVVNTHHEPHHTAEDGQDHHRGGHGLAHWAWRLARVLAGGKWLESPPNQKH